MVFNGLLHIDIPGLAIQQKLSSALWSYWMQNLEVLPKAMDDRDEWVEWIVELHAAIAQSAGAVEYTDWISEEG